MTDAHTPLLFTSQNSPIKKSKTIKTQSNKTSVILSQTTKLGADLHEETNNAKVESIGRLKWLQNRWNDVKQDIYIARAIQSIKNSTTLAQSKRKSVNYFTATNEIWDTIKYGYFKSPFNMNYNPFVQTTLIRAGASKGKNIEPNEEDENDTNNNSQQLSDEIETVPPTLPIYNGGNHVHIRKCDRNTHSFALKKEEWLTSWLSFEVLSDKILTHRDDFIGAVSIDLTGIQNTGQLYYTVLPLINKRNYSRQMQMKAEREYERTLEQKDGGKENIRYQKLEDKMVDMDSDIDLNITGVLHVQAVKKLTRDNVQDIFDENKNETYTLEIEILAITDMTTLKLDTMDNRMFYGGIFAFILYLLFYAMIMFVAEINESTGMNEYKESIWFALITVTTLGYGDIYPQTNVSKLFNALFITINIIVIATFVSNLLGYIVEVGEDALDHRMNHMMDGAEAVYQTQQKVDANKYNGKQSDSNQRRQSAPPAEIQKDVQDAMRLNRRKSAPNVMVKQVHKSKEKQMVSIEEQEEKKYEKAVDATKANELEAKTTKATIVKLNELTKLDMNEKNKMMTQIYVNIVLFALVVLFGFFTLGVAILLTGPNYLTSLPYFGYECVGNNDPFCQLDKSASTVFVDSLYFTIVSMTTVGYGDVYPKPGAAARVFGSLFLLFGTVLLVRLLDLISGYMIWKRNVGTKKRKFGKLLTSSAEFFQFDLDKHGSISKYEFLVGMLVKLDLVDMERINEIMCIFHETDRDGNGFVDVKELRQNVEENLMRLKWGENAWKEIHREWKCIRIAQEQMKIDRKSIKSEQKQIKMDGKEIKIKQDELNKKIDKFEKDKKEWQLQKKEMQNMIENDNKEESVEPQSINVNNNIDIIIDDNNNNQK